jgi:hypothetical protein
MELVVSFDMIRRIFEEVERALRDYHRAMRFDSRDGG